MSSSKPVFIDLFAGCGGMTLGLLQAGWDGLFAVEKNPMAFETIEANFLSPTAARRDLKLRWPTYVPRAATAIEDFLQGDLRRHLPRLAGDVDLVSGGPPCQGFSYSGKRRRDDVRNALVHAYADFVMEVRPKLILMENVPGIAVPHGTKRRAMENPNGLGRPAKSYAQQLLELLEGEYCLRHGVLDAADFGVPQRRKRFFLIGIRNDLMANSRITMASNGNPHFDHVLDPFAKLKAIRERFLADHGLRADRPVTAQEAIGDLSSSWVAAGRPCQDPQSPAGFLDLTYEPPTTRLSSAYVRLMRAGLKDELPNSLRLARHSEEVQKRFAGILENCRRGVRLSDHDRKNHSPTRKHRIVPLAPDQPSHTLTTLPDDLIHYSQPRTLTVRESARLQSFPDWFEFRGKFTTGGTLRRVECPRFTQVGNAVPPLIAEAWGLALKAILEKINQPRGRRLETTVSSR